MGNSISEQAAGSGSAQPAMSTQEEQQTSSPAPPLQDEDQLSMLERRAADAERKLESLEKRVESLGGVSKDVAAGTGSDLSATYVAELKGLRDILVEAEREQKALVERATALEKANAKLEYQVLHLKRSLQA